MIFWPPVQKIIKIHNALLVVIVLIVLGVVCCLDWKAGSTPGITMKKMIVAELKEELKKRGMDSTGTRPVLMERLGQAMQQEEREKLEEQYEDRPTVQEAEKKLEEQYEDGPTVQEAEKKPQDEAEEDGRPDGSEGDLPLGASASSIKRNVKLSGQAWASKQASVRSGQSQISTASARALEAARRAGLEAKMKMMKQRHQLEEDDARVKQRLEEERARIQQRLEEERAKVQHRKEKMKLMMELEEAKAREDVLKDFEVQQRSSVREQAHTPHVITEAPSANNNQLNMAEAMLESSRRSLLPRSEIPKFGGDITKFHSFIRAFDAKIGNRSMDCEEKLHFLEQFTSGRPRQIVQACFHMEPEQGYAEARRLLKKRYGDPSKVATAYTEKLLDWPTISADDVQGLDEMALYARGCFNAVKALEDSSELDHHKTLRMLVEKLPFHLQERWRREVDSVSEHKKRRVAFSDFVEFIETEARVASNSEFGRHVFKKTTRRGDVQRVKCNRTSPEEKEVCLFCSQEHALESCQAFSNRPLAARQEFVRQNRLCFGCLKFGHFSRSCPHRLTCSVCNGKHPSVMHVFRTAGAVNERQRREAELGTESTQPAVSVNAISSSDRSMKMPMIPVKVQYRDGPPVETYVFLDSGSSSTFCTYDLLSKLNVDVRDKTKLSVSTMSKDPLDVWASAVQGLSISDMSENNQITLPTVFALDKIPASREEICTAEDLQDWPHLQDVVPDVIDAEIGMLVGVNVPEALEPTDFIQSRDNSPYAVRTRLGWVVNGPVRKQRWAEIRATANRIKVEVQGFQMEENPASEERGWSVEDHKWMEKIDKEAKMDGGHYELPIPLKSDDAVLPDNREVCLRRLQGLGKKFQNESFADQYCEVIEDMAKKGYAERVPEDELGRADGLVNYLPHHGVFGKKDKLRVVFDCSSSFRGVSLNDMVFQGPSLCTPLIDVLTRFRQEEVAFMGDVNAMFHQVHVPSGHRDLLRYLWWRDGDPAEEVETWRMRVHPFGLRSSPSCASYALLRTVSDFGEEVSPEAAQTVVNNMYVDDLVKSVADVDQAVRLVKEVRELCEKGGFHMAKFVSNRREVLDSIPPEDRGKKVKDLDFDDDLPSERALGIEWHMESDTIGFAVKAAEKPPTRRGMLSVIGSVYDPLGMAAPFVLNGRIILQELVRRQYRWDEPAPEDMIVKWQEWLTGISLISDVWISRCVKPVGFGTVEDCQLHHFADASNEGYGVVSYLRMTNARGEVHCAFLFGKSRLAPLKGMTVPRLELTAATLAVRTDVLLRRALQIQIDAVYYWTDSTTVIRYIRNEHTRFHVFVANRLHVIRGASSPDQWKYVDSSRNPADDASRGQSAAVFVANRRWFRGPDFLWEESDKWPRPPPGLEEMPEEPDPEVKQLVAVRSMQVTPEHDPVDVLFDHFSSLNKLKRAVAWILRVKEKLRLRARTRGAATRSTTALPAAYDPLSRDELEAAGLAVVRRIQNVSFPRELQDLRNGQTVKGSSPLASLDPFLKDDMIRVGGRLRHAPVTESRRCPMVLPNSHRVVDLIIQSEHEEAGHEGREHTLANVRDKYWILKGNSAVRRVLRRCFSCRRRQAQPVSQKMADLPLDRVNPEQAPFHSTGVDYFGPFHVKRGRGHVKKYGVIFTCLTSRAVHLEVADSLSTDSFICALRRFIARRGQVRNMRSDRGTNFIGADRELKNEMENLLKSAPQINKAMNLKNISWTFNPPHASHFGGVWEREIRTVRKILGALLTQQYLTDESLQTFLCEVEAVMNGRPLTTVSLDCRDPEPLTPNHLLLLNHCPAVPAVVSKTDDLYGRKRWRQAQYMADVFWSRWRKEYSALLQARTGNLNKKRNLCQNDIVLMVDEAAPRNCWVLGRVTRPKVSGDGLVRSAEILSRGKMMTRPVSKLVLLVEATE